LPGYLKESLVVGCVKILERPFSDKTYSYEDVTTFIDGLTMTDRLYEVHFVEQPFLFYEVGEGRVMWDYLRHGGILRAVARKTAAAQSKSQAADTSGPGFEMYISNRAREADLQARDIKINATIRSCGQQVWDIDLGFVVDNVLLLVEAKGYQKNVKYHAADGGTVSDRIQPWESWCEKLDAKLQRYGEAVRRKWPNPAVAGALCIVCTEEAGFVASADRKYWLGLPEHPRVCTIDELLEFLQTHGGQPLVNHPCFYAFDAQTKAGKPGHAVLVGPPPGRGVRGQILLVSPSSRA
jgi:hypothetical protein